MLRCKLTLKWTAALDVAVAQLRDSYSLPNMQRDRAPSVFKVSQPNQPHAQSAPAAGGVLSSDVSGAAPVQPVAKRARFAAPSCLKSAVPARQTLKPIAINTAPIAGAGPDNHYFAVLYTKRSNKVKLVLL